MYNFLYIHNLDREQVCVCVCVLSGKPSHVEEFHPLICPIISNLAVFKLSEPTAPERIIKLLFVSQCVCSFPPSLTLFVFVCLCSAPPSVQKHPERSASDLLRLPALHVQPPDLLPHGAQTAEQTVRRLVVVL